MKRVVPTQAEKDASFSVIFFPQVAHTRVSPGPQELREGAATAPAEGGGGGWGLRTAPLSERIA